MTGGGEGDASLKAWNPRTGECTLTLQAGTQHAFHTAGGWLGDRQKPSPAVPACCAATVLKMLGVLLGGSLLALKSCNLISCHISVSNQDQRSDHQIVGQLRGSLTPGSAGSDSCSA